MIEPGLSLHSFTHRLVDFVDESGFITAPDPCFRNHCGDRSRRTTYLVCQGIPLLCRVRSAHFKDDLRLHLRYLIHFQISETLYDRHARFPAILHPLTSIFNPQFVFSSFLSPVFASPTSTLFPSSNSRLMAL